MTEITFEYWNKLANQTIMISSLLAGFSITVVANIMIAEVNSRLSNAILTVSTLAACLFLISVFSMTTVLLKTTNGFPFEVTASDFKFPRILGSMTFLFGTLSLVAMIGLAGFTKSKKMGILTTVLSVLTLILLGIVIS